MADEIVPFVTMHVRGMPEFVRAFRSAADATDWKLTRLKGPGTQGARAPALVGAPALTVR